MQDTIKSQRSDVFPKEKYVSSDPAEKRYDEEFVKLDEGMRFPRLHLSIVC